MPVYFLILRMRREFFNPFLYDLLEQKESTIDQYARVHAYAIQEYGGPNENVQVIAIARVITPSLPVHTFTNDVKEELGFHSEHTQKTEAV